MRQVMLIETYWVLWLTAASLHPEEFNDKILSPDLSDAELQRLHGEVQHIYETYCLEESIDKISFDTFIVEEIRNSKQPTLNTITSHNPSGQHPGDTSCTLCPPLSSMSPRPLSCSGSIHGRGQVADHALPV